MVFKRLFAALALAFGALSPSAFAADLVRVGGYDFPPFVETDSSGAVKGLTLDLIDSLNKLQSQYEFRFVPISARRRYSDLQDSRFDVMFFESPEWEWVDKKLPVDFSDVFLKGGEVFIAPAKPGRDQTWFDNLKGKRLVGILGYHYGFANFVADPDRLAKNWNIKLVANQRSAIDMVLADRMDVGVVTDSFLWSYLARNPSARDRLLISDRFDQRYNHRVLVRRNGPIDVARVNRLLSTLEQDGTLGRLWQAAGVVR